MHDQDIDQIGTRRTPFGPNEEKAIIALALDHPEFFTTAGRHISHQYFKLDEARWVMAVIEDLYEKSGVIPSRELVKDHALKNLTADDDYEPILEIIDQKSNPRDVPAIKHTLFEWSKDRAFGLLYDDEAIRAYQSGDYQTIERIFEEARNITDTTDTGLFFFDNLDIVFMRDLEEKLTTGFFRLDEYLNEGGPTRGEVLCWLAPTGVGKSILIPHTAIACLKRGYNVLHVTLELSKNKTALRYAGAISDVEVHKRFFHDEKIRMQNRLEKAKNTYEGRLNIVEFPPDEINVNHLYQLVDQLRRLNNWRPDVVAIDYMELMLSRYPDDNRSDYTKQKQISTQIRGFARNENVFVVTATQTNRETAEKTKLSKNIDVNRASESYGKMMPMDYVVSANQTTDEYNTDNPQLRLYIAKNRNGPKFKTIRIKVNYKTFKMEEVKPTSIR